MKLLNVFKLTAVSVLAGMMLFTSADAVSVGTVKASSTLNFREEASTSSEIIGKLPSKIEVLVLSQNNGWTQILCGKQKGYVSSDYLSVKQNASINGYVTTSTLNLRSKPNTSSQVLAKVKAGDKLSILSVENKWYKVSYEDKTAYAYSDYVSIGKYSDLRSSVLAYAATLIGVPYKHAGSSPKGFDCSGYTSYVFDHFDISLSRSSGTQYKQATKIKKSQLLPGDLVFFNSSVGSSRIAHVGIYVGNNTFIHAPSPGKRVGYDKMDSGYYYTHYVGSARIIF